MNTGSPKLLPWFSLTCFALVATFEVIRVIQQGIGIGTLTGLLLGGVLITGVFAYFDIRDFLRFWAVSAAHPRSFVSQVVMYPELVSQLNELVGEAGHPPLNIRSGRHGTIAIDATTFGIFDGYVKPKELFGASGLSLRDVRIVQTPQGLWKLQCLELEYVAGQKSVVIDIPLLQIRFGAPLIVSKRGLELLLPDVARFLSPKA